VRLSGHHSPYEIDEESIQVLLSPVIEEQWDIDVREDL